MVYPHNIRFLLIITALLLVISSCRMGQSQYMSEQQRQRLETAYDSLQNTYTSLMGSYESSGDAMPAEMQSMYAQMRQMHDQMDTNHRQIMSMRMGRHMQGNNMMAEGMGMHMQGNMTGEWYSQMMSMHERMAAMHNRQGENRMAEMNRRLSEAYGEMWEMIPDSEEETDVPFNEEGDPSLLNGESLYAQNCAGCHGGNAAGAAGVFPPLVDSEWVTGDKSVPVRILLHGLNGEIEVNGQSYRGSMPSFKARLSAAEMAAILNFLRAQSAGDLPELSQEDIIEIAETYDRRTGPWSAEELKEKAEDNR